MGHDGLVVISKLFSVFYISQYQWIFLLIQELANDVLTVQIFWPKYYHIIPFLVVVLATNCGEILLRCVKKRDWKAFENVAV